MPLVNVMVNGRAYTIACDDGEEEHLRELAAIVDAKVREVLGSVGQVGDTRLLLMAALLIADEHHGGRTEPDHHADAQMRSELEARAKAAESRASAAWTDRRRRTGGASWKRASRPPKSIAPPGTVRRLEALPRALPCLLWPHLRSEVRARFYLEVLYTADGRSLPRASG